MIHYITRHIFKLKFFLLIFQKIVDCFFEKISLIEMKYICLYVHNHKQYWLIPSPVQNNKCGSNRYSSILGDFTNQNLVTVQIYLPSPWTQLAYRYTFGIYLPFKNDNIFSEYIKTCPNKKPLKSCCHIISKPNKRNYT